MRIQKTAATVCGFIVLGLSCMDDEASLGPEAIPEKISYNFHIRPILSDKCFLCHGPDPGTREAGLRLDLRDSALRPLRETPGAFAIVPGKPEESELIRRVTAEDPAYMMPLPSSHIPRLSPEEVELLKRWIRQGAPYEPHWAFLKPEKHPLPRVSGDWAKNEIDHFILGRLRRLGLKPNPEADRERLLKKLSLDLTGLPPSIEQMDEFLQDPSPEAYERVVDRLLQSPAYGERLAVHWLDVSRYADSYGYQDDNIRTQWPYRDWLIHAFNQNMPYDRFLTLQLAGDMLPERDKETILATAFLRNHKYTEEGGVIDEEYRVEYNVDKTKTYSKGILGLTVECAQCHDHKYDPITQEDYFRLYAFFNNTYEAGYEGPVDDSKPAKMPILQITAEEVKNLYSFIHHRDTGTLMVSVMGERDTLRPTYVLSRGHYASPAQPVRAEALNVVLPFDTSKYTRDRRGLAAWTVSRDNPLTARVFVNQIWQEFFGHGLVKTSGDFGMQGDLPTHPELLDWLAADFMDNGWDIRHLIRKIVTSATYRQSAVASEEKLRRDPENKYYSRFPRVRLHAEFIRDLVLASSGMLVPEIGGPSVKPYQPEGLWEASTSGRGELTTYRQERGTNLYRRGIYTFIKLTLPPPSMMVFDASNRDQCEVKRLKTSTPLQALVMMNDPTVLEASRVLAERLVSESGDSERYIRQAFRSVVLRHPREEELRALKAYYEEQLDLFRKGELDSVLTLQVGEYEHAQGIDRHQAAALMKTISLLYNLDETLSKT